MTDERLETAAVEYYPEAGSCIETLLFARHFDLGSLIRKYLKKHRAYFEILTQRYHFFAALEPTSEVIEAQNKVLRRRLILENHHCQMVRRLNHASCQYADEIKLRLEVDLAINKADSHVRQHCQA